MFDEVIPDLLGEKDRTPPQGLSFDRDPGPTALRYAATLSNRKLRQTIELNPVLSGHVNALPEDILWPVKTGHFYFG